MWLNENKKEEGSLKVWSVGIVCLMIAVALAVGALLQKGYNYVEHDPRFCKSCHIMDEPFEKWSTSPHHLVSCHECHRQPLQESMRQVWVYATKRPKQVSRHPDLNHEVCAQCHLSQDPQWKLIGETAGHKIHFEKAGIDCLVCHIGGVHKFLRPVDACLTCHTDKGEGPGNKMTFMHCTDCHSFLAKQDQLVPDRARCLSCHQSLHVGRETFPAEAPMSSFDCSTCHKPHGKLRPDKEVCISCHVDAKTPHHRMTADMACTKCHQPHSWRVP